MKHTEQELSLTIGDASFDVWLESVEESSLKLMMKSISSMLSRSGWDMYTPFDDHLDAKKRHGVKFWREWSSRFRNGSKSGLEIKLYVCGRHLEIKLFENVTDHSKDNSHGGEYVFDKESKMPYLLRVSNTLTKNKIEAHLKKHYSIKETSRKHEPSRKLTPAIDLVNIRIREESLHYKKELDRADYGSDRNRTSANGTFLEEYQTVYVRDYSGRWCVGYTRYDLNMNWHVITGLYDRIIKPCWEIHTEKPEDLRTKDKGNRRRRLEQEMSKAVKLMDFDRAKKIKAQLFGFEPLFMIKKGDLYYGPCGSGYTSSDIEAGKYTEEEVKRYSNDECLKIVPLYK